MINFSEIDRQQIEHQAAVKKALKGPQNTDVIVVNVIKTIEYNPSKNPESEHILLESTIPIHVLSIYYLVDGETIRGQPMTTIPVYAGNLKNFSIQTEWLSVGGPYYLKCYSNFMIPTSESLKLKFKNIYINFLT